ncbi:cyclin-dependent kinase 18 [Oreochromis niloticus]|uniref:cyclin-dependent kinase 18 n=1 Tax=Oreochromis niloticus TaxID=8128 RepID=UPI000DF1CD5D|nr:cyclin-dependent kinase 18 [Oreochromis niloticus]
MESQLLSIMNKMKNFKRRFSLSVPRTETIEENEFTEQINQLNIRHTQGLTPDRLGPPSHDASPVSPEPTTPGAQSPSHLHYHSKAQHRRFSMEVSKNSNCNLRK